MNQVCITGAPPSARFDVPPIESFVDEDDETLVYDFKSAPELREIGRKLIKARDMFKHLRSADITYLWKREGGKRQNKPTLATIQKPSGLLRFFAETDYILWAAADWWHGFGLTNWQAEATVFHELCHTEKKEDRLILHGHDWEGFASEIHYYGAWLPDLESIERAFQPTLFTRSEREQADKGSKPRPSRRGIIAPGEIQR